jgi:hypothetical protein
MAVEYRQRQPKILVVLNSLPNVVKLQHFLIVIAVNSTALLQRDSRHTEYPCGEVTYDIIYV